MGKDSPRGKTYSHPLPSVKEDLEAGAERLQKLFATLAEQLKLPPSQREALWPEVSPEDLPLLPQAPPPTKTEEKGKSVSEEKGKPTPETAPKKRTLREKRQKKKVDRVMEARQNREEPDSDQEALFGLRPFIMCGLPLRKPKENVYSRRCGNYEMRILGDPDFGIPHGADRLIPIFLATAFVYLGCPRTNEISFHYSRDFLRVFDLPFDGRYYRRTREGFERFQRSLFSFIKPIQSPSGKKGRFVEAMPLLSRSYLWYEETPHRGPEAPNLIRLNATIAQEIREHPIPIDLETVRSLRDTPGALDFYQWQIWRSFFLTKDITVPVFAPGGLRDQLGFLQEQENFEIRRRLRHWQALVKLHWPECPNEFSLEGNLFRLRPGRALRSLQKNRFLLKGLDRDQR